MGRLKRTPVVAIAAHAGGQLEDLRSTSPQSMTLGCRTTEAWSYVDAGGQDGLPVSREGNSKEHSTWPERQDYVIRDRSGYLDVPMKTQERVLTSADRVRRELRPLEKSYDGQHFNNVIAQRVTEERVRKNSADRSFEEQRRQKSFDRSIGRRQLLEEQLRERQQLLERSMEQYQLGESTGGVPSFDEPHPARRGVVRDVSGGRELVTEDTMKDNNKMFAASRIMAEDIVRPLERVDGHEFASQNVDVR